MFVGEDDNIVSVKDNRWLKTQLESMVHYQELPFDHLSFLLADDMSYFDTVLDTIIRYNPVPDSISKKEKNRREVRQKMVNIDDKKTPNSTQLAMLDSNNKTLKAHGKTAYQTYIESS